MTITGTAHRTTRAQARTAFEQGKSVLVTDDRLSVQTLPVGPSTTTHSRETTTWAALRAQMLSWGKRQQMYVVHPDLTVADGVLTLTLAVSDNGNWALTPDFPENARPFPPMALPAGMSTAEARDYAARLLETAGILLPSAGLDWQRYGYTSTPSGGFTAYRARWSIVVENV